MTVVVTAFNRAWALEKALRSLSAQTRLPDEVIVSDDGSCEDILRSLKGYVDALDFGLIYVRQEDRGFRLARCRNNAVRAAAGDYLVFLDQDIVVTKGYLDLYAVHAQPREFLVAYPVMLDEEQSAALSSEVIGKGASAEVVTGDQIAKIRSQYRKDRFYRFLTGIMGRGHRPKVRGGAFGISKEDLARVDGFDENYIGWGTEDDDLGRRLYRAGITGRTVFLNDFPLHLWHPHETGAEDSPNLQYYNRRLREIARGDYRAVNGISNPLGDDVPTVVGV
jgi:GT2 family glycosyltransferase